MTQFNAAWSYYIYPSEPTLVEDLMHVVSICILKSYSALWMITVNVKYHFPGERLFKNVRESKKNHVYNFNQNKETFHNEKICHTTFSVMPYLRVHTMLKCKQKQNKNMYSVPFNPWRQQLFWELFCSWIIISSTFTKRSLGWKWQCLEFEGHTFANYLLWERSEQKCTL